MDGDVPALSRVARAARSLRGAAARGVGASEETLYSLFDTYWEWRLATQPELATRVGRTEYNDRWRDISKAGRDRARERRKEFLQAITYINTGNLTPSDRVSANVLQWELRNSLDMERYSELVGTVSQQNTIPKGSLNGPWGAIADAAARAAADGIIKLLPKSS